MQTVSDRTLTAANSILLMRVKGFNDNFVQIEGYAADNAFDFGQGKIGETMMGVDGKQSGGFTPYEVDFNIQLAPTSRMLLAAVRVRSDTVCICFPLQRGYLTVQAACTGLLDVD